MLKRCCAVALAGVVLLSGCAVDELTRDKLLVWHDWPEPEAAVLVELLDSYSDVNPDLDVIVEYVPEAEIEDRFASEVTSGFGPDVLIGIDAARIEDLTNDGAVHRISSSQVERYGFDDLDPKALDVMSIENDQRGIPLAAFTDVLYYRKDVTPPATLDDILELAEAGHLVAIPTGFINAYWGIDAFDGTMFGSDGDVDPDAGFVDWMEWLVEARPHPNIILDGEYDVLRDSFADGRIDLFIGGSRELGTFRAALREPEPGEEDDAESSNDDDLDLDLDNEDVAPLRATAPALSDDDDVAFGLTVLPGGDNENPGGLMDVEGMVINQHTATLKHALDLMEYLTNVPSQGRIARSGVGRIPVNTSVAIDPTISPIEAALVAQQRRATVLPRSGDHDRVTLRLAANDVVAQVTRGLLEPFDAPQALIDTYETILEDDDA